MTLIKSISGIRGTIGGQTGDTLNPLDIVKFTTAYATFIKRSLESGVRNQENTPAIDSALQGNLQTPDSRLQTPRIIVGRDGRLSGLMVRNVVVGTLMGMGYDVIDIGYATTPTTELAVRMAQADGGIIITASHNPRQWNALKLLNSEGEFLTAADGAEVLRIAEAEDFHYAEVDQLGTCTIDDTYNRRHIDSVLQLKLVDVEAIRQRLLSIHPHQVSGSQRNPTGSQRTAKCCWKPDTANCLVRTGLSTWSLQKMSLATRPLQRHHHSLPDHPNLHQKDQNNSL